VKVSYASLERYLEDIHRMVENGLLSEEKEFYAPVRLRGGKQMSDLPKTGIRYIFPPCDEYLLNSVPMRHTILSHCHDFCSHTYYSE
jgi:hypothetical protein